MLLKRGWYSSRARSDRAIAVAASTTRAQKTDAFARGTGGSNPLPSTGESVLTDARAAGSGDARRDAGSAETEAREEDDHRIIVKAEARISADCGKNRASTCSGER